MSKILFIDGLPELFKMNFRVLSVQPQKGEMHVQEIETERKDSRWIRIAAVDLAASWRAGGMEYDTGQESGGGDG